MLDSGKVDEKRFLNAIGNYFKVPVMAIDAKRIDRQTLSLLPSRFVFQHHILPIEVKENSVVLATYDLFNSVGRQLASQLLKKPAEWVLVPRAQILRAMKTLYGVGAETFDEILKTNRSFEADAGRRGEHRPERGRSGSFRRQIRQPDHPRSDRRARDGYSRRAAGERSAHPLSDRRHSARSRGAAAAAPAAIGHHLALKVMAHMDIAERRLPQDGRINLQATAQNIDVRVSTIPTVNGESISSAFAQPRSTA